MAKVFRGHGLDYDVDGLTGNTLDNHGLITFAGHRVTISKMLLWRSCTSAISPRRKGAKKVGIEGANEFLDDPNKGVQEVYAELEKYSDHITGIPYYVINGKNKLDGNNPRGLCKSFSGGD
ncbi:hypothetical protein IFM89_004210 [Coptis chinensis]|uniref:Uncharacterized protein n=1 Tax=Coptis chinensis TaxID=261450 RepID=A0A835I578_9MAGN|nr:hypothetical protein IFM89_004210 [Coptis chinensis]